MNLKHGFYSKDPNINGDMKLLGNRALTNNELSIADSFLRGDSVKDPLVAHQIVKAIYATGRFKYPTLFNKAGEYCSNGNIDYQSLERL